MALDQATAAVAAGASVTSAVMSPGQLLVVLVLGGTMGLLGQGVRAVVGLKSMTDDARVLNVSPSDLFQAARLLTSLMIGVIVGLAEALAYLAGGGGPSLDWHVLIGFAATAYAGTDFLEGFISTYLAPGNQPNVAALTRAKNIPLTAALAKAPVPAPITTAQQLVYSLLNEALPSMKITSTTKLADIGFGDGGSNDTIRAAINYRNWRGVDLPVGALNEASTVADIIKIVAAAEKPRGQ